LNKLEIQSRIEAINMEMTQTKANYAKLEGHLGEAQHWLVEAIKKETEAQVEKDKESLNVEANPETEEQPASESVCGAEAA
jgi:hypothetical protein